MLQLRFALRDVLDVAAHAVAAPAHKASFVNTVDGTTPGPALWFVGDDGLYLMSNGLPGQPHPGGGRLHVVYADGYRTAMAKHAVAGEIGGDDFCEPLPLLEPAPDGLTLHARLTAGLTAGLDLLVIDLDATAMQLFLADTREVTR
ncbi:DUF3085 domain-containing protein [Dactylosporangium matsuzakiense]|uniref:Uncharacterized protein n=1 Tax=Dactylosporangium matsuzakiense TaxID=53360 RepID=A0A9W6NN98_9ACTN|nr:DUF3085 domain-containing protein [Dactylosporangium matsuzakiense]GLL03730.1 hypothetical protein GCM10017581_054760 [Dactylosporangium matsuzakiense]